MVGASNARKNLYRILERAGIPREDRSGRSVDIHALRTTYGSRMAREGVPPQVLQYLMGHADVQTTMKHYVFLRMEDAQKALTSITPLPRASANPDSADRAPAEVLWNKIGTD